ncbi:MAG: DoxX family protein [Chthoniobacterales bacterium]
MNEISWVRTFLSELHAWQWAGSLAARFAVGLLFFLSGRGKLFVPKRRAQMRDTLVAAGVPFPDFNTIFVSAVEFLFGFLLILGVLTPVDCVMLGCVMIGAILTTALKNIQAPPVLGWLSEFLYLPEVLYLLILLWLFLAGPGWFSVDHLILCKAGP